MEAENGVVALQRLETVDPAVILLDLVMPEMDGFTLAARLREDPATRQTPVVVVTGKELTPEERAELNGSVARVVRKGDAGMDVLGPELQLLIQRGRTTGPAEEGEGHGGT